MKINVSLQPTNIKVSIDLNPIEPDAELHGDSVSGPRESPSPASTSRHQRSTNELPRPQPANLTVRVTPASKRPLLDLIEQEELNERTCRDS